VISAIVLAAGRATRFGSTKQLAVVDGKPLVQHAVDAAAGGGCDEVVVVLGHDADRVERALRLPPNARMVRNPSFAEGQSTSLRAGLAALGGDSEAAVVLLADQPGIEPTDVAAVIEGHRSTGAPIVRARFRGVPGHPVLLSRDLWPDAMTSTGDAGARELIAARPDRVHHVDIDRDPPPDIDTPTDLDLAR